MAVFKNDNGKFRTGRALTAAVFAILLILTLCSSLTKVDTGCTGVVKTFGAPTGKVLNNGLHFKIPWVQSVEEVDTQIIKVQEDANAVSKDLQSVNTTIAVNYQINPSSAVAVVQKIGAKFLESEIVVPAIQESVKAVTAKYTAEELIASRASVSQEMSAALGAKIKEYGVAVQGFNVINFSFSEEFNRAIESKQVAQQNLIRIRTEQEELVVKAEAQAKAAEANAKAVLVAAEAQAEANQKLAESITPNLVEYEKIKKWDGKLPTVSGGDAIVDIRE